MLKGREGRRRALLFFGRRGGAPGAGCGRILSQALRGGGLPICKLLPAPPPCKSPRKSLVRSLAPVFRRAAFFVTARLLCICDLWRVLSRALRGGGLPICKLLPAPPPCKSPRTSKVPRAWEYRPPPSLRAFLPHAEWGTALVSCTTNASAILTLIFAHSLVSSGGHYLLRSPRGARNSVSRTMPVST